VPVSSARTVNTTSIVHWINAPGFVGINAAALKKQLAAGKGDGEILAWIKANAKYKRTEPEIAAWSVFAEQRVPADLNHGIISTPSTKYGRSARTSLTWFDLLLG